MNEAAEKKRVGFRQVGVVLGLMIVAGLALAHTVDVTLEDEAGVRMVLPEIVGEWSGAELRYCHQDGCRRDFVLEGVMAGAERCPECGSPLFTMSREEYDALPKDTEFIKSKYTNSDGEWIHVAIVLSGQERNSIHRPQRCLVGQGFVIRNSRVLNVPMPNAANDIDVMVLQAARNIQTPEGPDELRMYYAYWFVGQGRETPYHLERMFWLAWDRVFQNTSHKWAYISVSGVRGGDEQVENEEIRSFVAQLHEGIVL